MLRREAISLLLGAGAGAGVCAVGAASLTRFVGAAAGAAILIDIPSRRLLAAHAPNVAARVPQPPGSTVKPFVVAALLRLGRLTPTETFPCPGRLRLAGVELDCSHPPVAPMRATTAISYSCNCFVAHYAARFRAGELARELEHAGLCAQTGLFRDGETTGHARPAAEPDAIRLQALGEDGIDATLGGLAMAYRQLALRITQPELQPIAEGLEGAVAFGTAQNAQVAGLTVAGKTGSVRTRNRMPFAWFAGFAPSRDPRVVVAVRLEGFSGGSDAAPVAGRILEAWHAGRL